MRLFAIALVCVAASGCCCFGDFQLPAPRPRSTAADEPAIEAAAREYVVEHAHELLDPAASRGDAGAGSCAEAITSITMSMGAAVITRGHAGSEVAAHVWFDLAACGARIRVVLTRTAQGVWIVVGAETLIGSETIVTLGSPVRISPDYDDLDLGSDELF